MRIESDLASRDATASPRLRAACQDFEALLLASLWKTLQPDELDASDDNPLGVSMTDWGIDFAAQGLARAGGIGLAKLVLDSLTRPTKVPAVAADTVEEVSGRTPEDQTASSGAGEQAKLGGGKR